MSRLLRGAKSKDKIKGEPPKEEIVVEEEEEEPEPKIETVSISTQTLPPRHYGCFYWWYIVMQIFGIAVVVLIFYWTLVYLGGLGWSSKPQLQFNWHPLLQTIGMIYLYGNSILVYRTFRKARKCILKLIHAWTFVSVLFLAFFAFWAVIEYKELRKIPHFYSLHSWIGLIAIGLFVLQFLAGFISFLCPVLPNKQREKYVPVHVFFGLAGFVLAISAALLGLCEKQITTLGVQELPGETIIINTLGLVIAVFAAMVVYLATNKYYKRIGKLADRKRITIEVR